MAIFNAILQSYYQIISFYETWLTNWYLKYWTLVIPLQPFEEIFNGKVILLGNFDIPSYNMDTHDNPYFALDYYQNVLKLNQCNGVVNVLNLTLDFVLPNAEVEVTRAMFP